MRKIAQQGMQHETGKTVSGLPYLQQRIANAFNTERGELVGERDYGVRFDDLVDRNIDNVFFMHVFARVAEAIMHEPNGLHDLKIESLELQQAEDNTALINIYGSWNGQSVDLVAPLSIAA